MDCVNKRNLYLYIIMTNYFFLCRTCKNTLYTINNLTHFPVNPLCNSLYCQVDFEYSNKQKEHDIFTLAFKKIKALSTWFYQDIIIKWNYKKPTIEIYTKKLTIKHFWHAINTFISLKQSKINIDNEMQ